MRRQFITALLAAGLMPSVYSQTPAWPAKPIRVIVGFPAGTPPDIFARLYADRLAKSLGVPLIVDNRPGVGGNLAADAVAKSPGDGLTLLYTVSNAITMNPHLYGKMPFDPGKDLLPVAPTLQQGLVIVANNSVAARNVRELTEFARTSQVTYGSYGPGGYPHLVMETLLDAAKVTMTHVPYRAGVMNDLVGGRIHFLAEPIATAMGFIESKRVKPIAYTGATRHPSLPDVPTIAETYPGVTAIGWHGFWAPGTTSQEIVKKLNELITEATRSPEISRRITDLHCQTLTATPLEMAASVNRDSVMWGKVIREKGIKLD